MQKSIGLICLAVYLLLIGAIGLFGISLGSAAIIIPILAIVAGIALLLGR